MIKKILIFMIIIQTSLVFADKVENVEILKITPGNNNFELKLKAKSAPQGSYFYVDIVKGDVTSFDKLGLVIQKIEKKSNFILSLDIPSFSQTPSGSYYKSDSVSFFKGK